MRDQDDSRGRRGGASIASFEMCAAHGSHPRQKAVGLAQSNALRFSDANPNAQVAHGFAAPARAID